MIFVSIGTHPQPFTRLLCKIDRLIENKLIREEVIAQTGYTKFDSNQFKTIAFLSLADFDSHVKNARLVITHGGEGNIGACLQHHKPMVIVPRLAAFNEHTNDHQLELSQAIADAKKGIVILDIEKLANAIEQAPTLVPSHAPAPTRIIGLLDEFTQALSNPSRGK